MGFKENIEGRSRDNFCSRKAKCITYSECVSLALFIQISMRMRLIILPSVAVPHFAKVSHKSYDFRKKSY